MLFFSIMVLKKSCLIMALLCLLLEFCLSFCCFHFSLNSKAVFFIGCLSFFFAFLVFFLGMLNLFCSCSCFGVLGLGGFVFVVQISFSFFVFIFILFFRRGFGWLSGLKLKLFYGSKINCCFNM